VFECVYSMCEFAVKNCSRWSSVRSDRCPLACGGQREQTELRPPVCWEGEILVQSLSPLIGHTWARIRLHPHTTACSNEINLLWVCLALVPETGGGFKNPLLYHQHQSIGLFSYIYLT